MKTDFYLLYLNDNFLAMSCVSITSLAFHILYIMSVFPPDFIKYSSYNTSDIFHISSWKIYSWCESESHLPHVQARRRGLIKW